MPAVVVQIEDQNGNAVPQSGTTVTLALSAGTLSGTNPQVTDANGKATFNDLSIPPISSGLYLTASAAGFSPVQSSVFNAPPKTFYKLNNTSALNLPASWTATPGGVGPAVDGIVFPSRSDRTRYGPIDRRLQSGRRLIAATSPSFIKPRRSGRRTTKEISPFPTTRLSSSGPVCSRKIPDLRIYRLG